MLLTRMQCDGCGRKPNLMEWFRGEFSTAGYSDWRHPGIAFKEAGCPMNYENRDKVQRLFQALFGHPMPDDLGYLCPHCQTWVEQELPELAAMDAHCQTVVQQYPNRPPFGV